MQISDTTGYRWVVWRPGFLSPHPAPAELAWAAMHYLHMFSNRSYTQLLAYHGEELAHRSTVFPRWMRYPFMNPIDLQIGNVWTHPQHRDRGLASVAIQRAVAHLSLPGRAFWYVTAKDNPASIAVAKKAGFQEFGQGRRVAHLGLRVLGAFALESASDVGGTQEG